MNQQKSQLKIGIILNYVNLIVGNLIPIFYTPIMLQLLGQQEYGLYKLSSSVTSYLSLISLGIGSAMTRYLIKSRTDGGAEEERRYLGLFVTIFHVIAAATLVIGTLLCWKLDIWYGDALTAPELVRMRILVFLMVCNMALGLSQSPYVSVVSAHERFLFQQCINIVTTCLGPTLNLVALALGFASIGMAVSSFLITVICRIAYVRYVKKTMAIKPNYHRMPTSMLREILVFSFWVFVSNIVGQLYNATDTVLIGMIPALATTGVAVYSVGNTFNTIVFSLTIGISSMLSPRTNQLVFQGASNRELTDLSIKVGRLQGYIIALIVTGFIAFGQPFIRVYAGPEYGEAYWVAILMMIPNMIPLVQSVCLNIIVAQNKHQFRSIVYLAIAILNVAGTWFALKIWGIVGAALVTGLALILGQGFAMNWYYQKKTGLDMLRFWREVGKLYIIPACLCIATVLLSHWIDLNQIGVWIFGVVLYTGLYGILSWRFVMNAYEKSLVLEPVRRLWEKLKRKSNRFGGK